MFPRSRKETTTQGPPIRILSLDGGGVRGLSSLLLLREIMERIAIKKNMPSTDYVRPSECFDLIIGTGTGGISALFLGRLRMTVGQAIDAYIHTTTTAFIPSSSLLPRFLRSSNAQLDSHALKRSISIAVKQCLADCDAPLEDLSDESTSCRTAVLAATSAHADAPPYIFRSYVTDRPTSHFTVHEVARATVAAVGLFGPISLGTPPIRFMNAGLTGCNNPAEIAVHEAGRIWPGLNISCLVSLGAGLQKIISVGGKWDELADASEMILQDCERVHYGMFRRRHLDGLAYYRFNTTRGLDMGGVQEWDQTTYLERLTGITAGYTRQPEIEEELTKCVDVLIGEKTASTVYDSEDIGKFLPLLNPTPEIFHGREEYVERAVMLLEENKAVRLAILGSGGIGKTTIAQFILHHARVEARFQAHRRFVSCEGITSTSFLVDTLCTAFGLHNDSTNRQKDLLVFLSHTYTNCPVLLILDNFETIWDVGPTQAQTFLQMLGKIQSLSLILTMRGSKRPAGLRWTSPPLPLVEPLSATAARQVYLDIQAKEDEQLAELLQAVDHVPLAVILMARLGQEETPACLLKRWKIEQVQLLSSPWDQGKSGNVEVSIRLSLESNHMQTTPNALLLLSVIAILPAGVFANDLLAVCPKIANRDQAAQALREVGLAYYDALQTLRVLSPIRAYITHYHPPKHELLRDVLGFHFQLAALGKQNPDDSTYGSTVAMLSHAEQNIEAVITKAFLMDQNMSGDHPVIQAALDWSNFIYWKRPKDDPDQVIHLAIACARKTGQQERLAQCLQILGNIQRMLNNYKAAQDTLLEAQANFKALDNQLGVTQCLQRLGNIEQRLDNHKGAQSMLLEARARFRDIGDQKGAAQCLRSLGDIEISLGELEAARATLSRARDESMAIGARLVAAYCLQSLGNIQQTLNDHKDAESKLLAARAEFKALGGRHGAAVCLQSLGVSQVLLGNLKQGQSILTAARAEFRARGERRGAARCLQSLGDIQRQLKNYQEARDMLSAARAELKDVGDRLGVACCLKCLGYLSRDEARPEEARFFFRVAKERFEQLGTWTRADQHQCSEVLTALSP